MGFGKQGFFRQESDFFFFIFIYLKTQQQKNPQGLVTSE